MPPEDLSCPEVGLSPQLIASIKRVIAAQPSHHRLLASATVSHAATLCLQVNHPEVQRV